MEIVKLEEKYKNLLAGVLGCLYRVICTGTLKGACYAAGMGYHIRKLGMLVFDYKRVRDKPREY